jgi:hypothetical protein
MSQLCIDKPVAVRLLKDKHFSANLSPVLPKLKPNRQVECVELMVSLDK